MALKTNLLLEPTSIDPQPQKACKGLFYRGFNSMWCSDVNITHKQGMRFLKRMSCKGCERCGAILEYLNEFVEEGNLIMPAQIGHGSLYSIRVTNVSRCWESGQVDDWDLEVFEIIKPITRSVTPEE